MSGSSSRRGVILGLATLPLTGAVFGHSLHRGTGPDLSFVAEEWLRDAYALGMLVLLQPDGGVWRTIPIHDGRERARAREEHWVRLQNRPRLYRAVCAKAEQGFKPWEPSPCA
ncbi:hypothetical protein MPOCJGCO_2850 [Methylobacterium trifolii]|uniref:Uncharacterized protein n=1 Tax=Methylobacterium trifolii TaxID=1003092 RepID=A0ABQ4TZR3_9HYPH|nr:hypothetical protein MPOCJGCO_2850 [Methylobacterium trifolii]